MNPEDKNKAIGCLTLILILLILAFIAICTGLGGDFSDGHRDGTVQKFSKRGVLISSWEGEMGLPGLNRKNLSAWEFSVESEEVAKEINELPIGAEVRLHYKQHLLYNPIKYRTGYRVYKIERVK